jgi:hypothetical protein
VKQLNVIILIYSPPENPNNSLTSFTLVEWGAKLYSPLHFKGEYVMFLTLGLSVPNFDE